MDIRWSQLKNIVITLGTIVKTIIRDFSANSFLTDHWLLISRFYLHPWMYLPVIYFIVLVVLWVRFGRDNKAHWTDSVEYKPPQALEAWKALIIIKQGIYTRLTTSRSVSRIISSVLLNLYYKGNLDLKIDKNRLAGITAVKAPDYTAQAFEKAVYSLLLGNTNAVDLRHFRKQDFILKARELVFKETGAVRPEIMTKESLKISNAVGGFISGLLEYVNVVSIAYICAGLEFIFMVFIGMIFLSVFALFSGIFFLILPWPEKGQNTQELFLLGGYGLASVAFWLGANRFRKTKFWIKTRAGLHKIWSLFEYPVYITLKAVSYLFIYLAFTLWLGLPVSIALSITLCLILSMIFSPLLPKWNAESLILLRQLKGYKNFLRKVEVPVIKQLAAEDPMLLQKVLPYAVIFGYARRWQKILNKLGINDSGLVLLSDFQLYLYSISGEALKLFDSELMADTPSVQKSTGE